MKQYRLYTNDHMAYKLETNGSSEFFQKTAVITACTSSGSRCKTASAMSVTPASWLQDISSEMASLHAGGAGSWALLGPGALVGKQPQFSKSCVSLRVFCRSVKRSLSSSRENSELPAPALDPSTAMLSPCFAICRWNIFSSIVPCVQSKVQQ